MSKNNNVIDFKEKKKEINEEKRRDFERVVFENFLGAYSTIDDQGTIYPIQMVDISRTGCLFQVPWNVNNDKKFEQGKEVDLRMYFTKNSYLPIIVKVKYGNEFVDKDGQTYMRYGGEFDKSTECFKALDNFIEFLYSYSELSHIDKGSHKVYFL